MIPFVIAFVVIGPLCLAIGLGLGYVLFATKEDPMAVYPEVQSKLDELAAAVAALPDKINSLPKPDPAAEQDKADTIAAVQSGAQAAVDAINAVGTAP